MVARVFQVDSMMFPSACMGIQVIITVHLVVAKVLPSSCKSNLVVSMMFPRSCKGIVVIIRVFQVVARVLPSVYK